MGAGLNYSESVIDTEGGDDQAVVARMRRGLRDFDPISLAEMETVALLDRTDTKYILPAGAVPELLKTLSRDYRVLDFGGRRLNRYRTVYFDTKSMDLYLRHHADNEVRHKVRSREYVEDHLAYLELKRKTNKDRTIKERIQTPSLVTASGRVVDDFLLSQFPLAQPGLAPRLTNAFYRATLVSNAGSERLTLDLNLSFTARRRRAALPGIVIVEVKQAGFDRRSPVIKAMRSEGIPPRGISKYCLGVALLYPEVKHNNFKPRLLLLEKLMRGDRDA
jgi:hypothetical protein